MKKCFIFFTVLIITLMIAVLTEDREAEAPLETVAVGTSNLNLLAKDLSSSQK